MNTVQWPGAASWPSWQKVLFRFFCCYFLLYAEPWTWIGYIPYLDVIVRPYYDSINWLVEKANQHIFKVYDKLVYPNGSGDTSYNWTQVWLYLLFSLAVCIVWSLIDRKRANYNRLAYWARIVVRYFVIINCFGYGIIKLFALQMYFPNLSQLATPLGDYLPMRLSWMFMGYSTPYQQFSGAMEVLAGILMLFRRTHTFGNLLATGVFCNVMMMNYSFDIPVKLFSTHLFIMCLFLLAFEYKRIVEFFIRNRPAAAAHLYEVRFPARWMRVTRIVLKCLFILMVVILPFNQSLERYLADRQTPDPKPIQSGFYEVDLFVLDNDTLESVSDSLRWKDVIFEKGRFGSINTSDTTFRIRYGRGYFNYSHDSAKKELSFTKNNAAGESFDLFTLKYEIPDSNLVILKGDFRGKALYTKLRRKNRHFQLAEKQFHWLSEYNR